MHNRTLKLFSQAREEINKTFGKSDAYNNLVISRFAVLIIKECSKVARDADLSDVEGGDGAVLRAAAEQIEQHFGITP